jgi:hypothetical protein
MAGILLLALSGIAASTALGLIRRKSWAWWIAVFLFAINGLGDAVSILVTRDLIRGVPGLLIAGGFLFTLSRPVVRQYFVKSAMCRPERL